MKLQQITEMAAKKLCPLCGKTMAANHYWYKGGWKCKKSSQEGVEKSAAGASIAPVAPIVNVPAPAQKASAPAEKPPAPKASKPVSLEQVRAMVPELEFQEDGDDVDIYWQVTEYKGKINVVYDYTFKRDTLMGAYMDKQRKINAANARLAAIANKFPDSVLNIDILTPAHIKDRMKTQDMNGEPAYSEYEQSIGGGMTLMSS